VSFLNEKIIPIISVSLLVSLASSAGESAHFFRDPVARDKHSRDKVVHSKKLEVIDTFLDLKSGDKKEISISDGVLKSISLSSNASLKADHIENAFKKYIGKKIGDKEATEIIEHTKEIYRDQGFLLTKVTLDNFNAGNFNIKVLEGSIGEVRLEIEKSHENEIISNSLLKTYIERITSMSPARTKDVQRQLLLISKIPGFNAEYGLVPVSSAKSASDIADLVVSIKMKKAKLDLDLTNHGSSALGKYQISAFAQIFNPTKHNDSLILSAGTTNKPSKMQLLTVGYLKRLNTHGTSASIIASHSRDKDTHSSGTSGSSDTSSTVRAQVSHYLMLNNTNSARLDVGIEHRAVKEKDSTQTLSDYNYNIGFVGGKIKHKDFLGGETWLNPMFFKTLGKAKLTRAVGALTNFARNFSLFTLDAFRDQPLPNNFSLFKQMIWHSSSDKVPNEHQFFVGSHTIGRGYKTGLINSNKGINFDAELRYDHFLENKSIELVQPFAYYDISHFSSPLQTANKKTLSSAGAGLRVFGSNGFRAEIEVGVPFTKNVTVGGVNKKSSTKVQFLLGKSFEW
jgi:hemolysin activation/secretion protein